MNTQPRNKSLTWSSMFKDEVLIIKLASINGLAPSAVVIGEISALTHKLRDDSVEAAALESKAFLMCTQTTKVFYGQNKQKSICQYPCGNMLIGKHNVILHKELTQATPEILSK